MVRHRMRLVTTVLVLAFVGCCGVFCTRAGAQVEEQHNRDTLLHLPEGVAPPLENGNSADVVARIVERTNEFRADQEREAVEVNPTLAETAQEFAEYMARTGRYGHTADDHTPGERAHEHDYEFCLIAENIAYQWNSKPMPAAELAGKFVQGWEESPPHRKNMLNENVVETGVGVARSAEHGTFFAVQMFGRPQTLNLKFQIENQSAQTIRYRLGEKDFSLSPRFTRTHERCLPSELTFAFETAEPSVHHPADGDRFLVELDSEGTLKVTRTKE